MQLAIAHRFVTSFIAAATLCSGVDLSFAAPCRAQDAPTKPPPVQELPTVDALVLGKRDLKFGGKQLKRMLHDRPRMKDLVQKNDALWMWSIRQFGGESTGRRYKWIKKTSHEGHEQFPAWHDYSMRKKLGWITVNKNRSDGLPATPEEMWSGAIFEMFNTRNDEVFQRLVTDAFDGKLSKDEFIKRSTRLEYNAVKATNDFYESTWKPHVAKLGYESCNAYWFPDLPSTYEEWAEKMNKAYPAYFNYFDKCYESTIANSKIANSKVK